jgi:hypothetical protein
MGSRVGNTAAVRRRGNEISNKVNEPKSILKDVATPLLLTTSEAIMKLQYIAIDLSNKLSCEFSLEEVSVRVKELETVLHQMSVDIQALDISDKQTTDNMNKHIGESDATIKTLNSEFGAFKDDVLGRLLKLEQN